LLRLFAFNGSINVIIRIEEPMSYDWEKIFKSKTEKELYQIYTDKVKLNKEAKVFAKQELMLRKFEFDKVDLHKKKWELENLIEEEKDSDTNSLLSTNEYYNLFMGFLGIIYFIFQSLAFKDKIEDESLDMIDFFESLSHVFIAILLILVGFIGYRKKKKRRKYRTEKIKTLRREIR